MSLSCSFCHKPQADVVVLVAAHPAYICDGCVALCVTALARTIQKERDLKIALEAEVRQLKVDGDGPVAGPPMPEPEG